MFTLLLDNVNVRRSPSPLLYQLLRSSLKRRSAEDSNSNSQQTSINDCTPKRPKRGIIFDNVTVYYFPRIQGFGCVPSQGGCTLGMGALHTHFR